MQTKCVHVTRGGVALCSLPSLPLSLACSCSKVQVHMHFPGGSRHMHMHVDGLCGLGSRGQLEGMRLWRSRCCSSCCCGRVLLLLLLLFLCRAVLRAQLSLLQHQAAVHALMGSCQGLPKHAGELCIELVSACSSGRRGGRCRGEGAQKGRWSQSLAHCQSTAAAAVKEAHGVSEGALL